MLSVILGRGGNGDTGKKMVQQNMYGDTSPSAAGGRCSWSALPFPLEIETEDDEFWVNGDRTYGQVMARKHVRQQNCDT